MPWTAEVGLPGPWPLAFLADSVLGTCSSLDQSAENQGARRPARGPCSRSASGGTEDQEGGHGVG